jgi:hypothetical protein
MNIDTGQENELSTHGYHQVNKLTGWKRRDMQSEEAD